MVLLKFRYFTINIVNTSLQYFDHLCVKSLFCYVFLSFVKYKANITPLAFFFLM